MSLGWKPGSPRTGLCPWGGSKIHIARLLVTQQNSGKCRKGRSSERPFSFRPCSASAFLFAECPAVFLEQNQNSCARAKDLQGSFFEGKATQRTCPWVQLFWFSGSLASKRDWSGALTAPMRVLRSKCIPSPEAADSGAERAQAPWNPRRPTESREMPYNPL